jgi:hypothetical protein
MLTDCKPQVLMQVDFSYAAAANSILWPILSLITFGTSLIIMRCVAWHRMKAIGAPARRTAVEAVAQSVPNSVGGNGTEPTRRMSLPPMYAEGNGANAASLEFSGIWEKNPAFDMGDGAAVGGGPVYEGHSWGIVQPPPYADLVTAAGAAAKAPIESDAGGSATSRTADLWASNDNAARY